MKKILAAMLAGATVLSMASISAFAASAAIVDSEGTTADFIKDVTAAADITGTTVKIDGINPDQTVYVDLGANTDTIMIDGVDVSYEKLMDTDYFSLSVKNKEGDGAKLVKVTGEDSKNINNSGRHAWFKLVIANSLTDSELKANFDVELKAKSKAVKELTGTSSGAALTTSSKLTYTFKMWINNSTEKGDDATVSTGDKVIFDPSNNETNTFVWDTENRGERAALYFEADDDASKFYAKLSTKNNSEIYSEYGDPVGADLWFYDFVGHPTISSTSRATLTLGIPWDTDDDAISTSPEDCFIYELSDDGTLTDVTSKFTYSTDNENTTDIEGWSIKTRTLGTYVVSDTELNIAADDVTTSEPAVEEPTTTTPAGDKVIPNTGSSDMVNVAVVAAVVSLAAAGAVAFRKVK